MAAGVYQITCVPTGKSYIGSSGWSLLKRLKKHRRDLDAGTHHSSYLQRAWNKHGADAFVFELLVVCHPNKAVTLEQELIDRLKPVFNTNAQATSCLGTKRTPEQRERYRLGALKRHAEGRGATHGLIAHNKSDAHRERMREVAKVNQPAATAARRKIK